MLIGTISDTHAPRFWKTMPPGVRAALQPVDLICHAGDICEPSVLDQLQAIAPVRVVQGNNDNDATRAWGAVDTLEWSEDGVSIAMVHDAGPRTGRARRLEQRFPAAQLIIYGHSHIPMLDEGDERVKIINPGSATDKRRQPFRTLAIVSIQKGRVESAELIQLP